MQGGKTHYISLYRRCGMNIISIRIDKFSKLGMLGLGQIGIFGKDPRCVITCLFQNDCIGKYISDLKAHLPGLPLSEHVTRAPRLKIFFRNDKTVV